MRQIRLATRYAKALFDFTEEQKVREEVFADMQMLVEVCRTNHDFQVMLHSPVIKSDKKINVLKALFESRFHNITMKYLQ